MPFNVAITGATGFIGAAVLTDLLAGGAQVTVLMRPDSNPWRLASLGGVEKITYSGLPNENTIRLLKEKKPEVFVHCAWHGVGGNERDETFQIADNVPMIRDAVELAAAVGCRQWIGFGSQAEYGNQNCRMSEDSPLRPTTLYGKAKLAAGISSLALCEARGMTGTWLRVFSTYGPYDGPQWLIPYTIQEFLAGRAPKLTRCEQSWDYLYVRDAASAVVSVAATRAPGVFNLGSGSAEPLKKIIETIRGELAVSIEPAYGAIPYRTDQIMHLEADISRLSAATGWSPKTSLTEGIRATIAFERGRRSES